MHRKWCAVLVGQLSDAAVTEQKQQSSTCTFSCDVHQQYWAKMLLELSWCHWCGLSEGPIHADVDVPLHLHFHHDLPLCFLHSRASGAGEREAELLLLQVQPQADVHQGAEGPAVGVPAAAAADLHRLPADPAAEARHGAGQPPHPHPLAEDRAQLQGGPLAEHWL